MKILNLGIVAHVDAGKTSLTERLLFEAGVISVLGSVDQGNTQTDTLELERQRGITIQSAVTSFTFKDVKINLIDTPGHSDFIAEVERALKVLDGVVLVISAVEGIQTQTRILMHTLKKLKISTLFFINKIDRKGARYEELIDQIQHTLSPDVIPMRSVEKIGTKEARVVAFAETERKESLLLHLADKDESFLERGLDDATCLKELKAQVEQTLLYPIFCGSAMTGVGILELMEGIVELLPAQLYEKKEPLSGVLFKIERGNNGEKIAYARLYSGEIATRDALILYRQERSGEANPYPAKVTALQSFNQGKALSASTVSAGNIAKIWGLKEAKIGDALNIPKISQDGSLFFPPTLEIVVEAQNAVDEPRLFKALQMMAEQDPLINARKDPVRKQITVSLYGEVQKEIIQAQLQTEFGIPVLFKEMKTIYIERLMKSGEAFQEIKRREHNEFYATLGLKIEPGEPDSGVCYKLGVELGSMPKSYHHVVEEMVYKTLQRGLYGWEITDCIVTLTRTGICALSSACEFRKSTPLVLMSAILQAGTYVCEPVSRFELEIPAGMQAPVISALISVGATLKETISRLDSIVIEGALSMHRVLELEKQLPALTQGCALFFSHFGGYQPVVGPPPRQEIFDGSLVDRRMRA